eukprot:jgi/Bigna1/144091/aug1.84_g18799
MVYDTSDEKALPECGDDDVDKHCEEKGRTSFSAGTMQQQIPCSLNENEIHFNANSSSSSISSSRNSSRSGSRSRCGRCEENGIGEYGTRNGIDGLDIRSLVQHYELRRNRLSWHESTALKTAFLSAIALDVHQQEGAVDIAMRVMTEGFPHPSSKRTKNSRHQASSSSIPAPLLNAGVHVIAKSHQWAAALAFIEQRAGESYNLKTANLAAYCYGGLGQWEKACVLLQRLYQRAEKSAEVQPNAHSLTIVANACLQCGHWQRALAVLSGEGGSGTPHVAVKTQEGYTSNAAYSLAVLNAYIAAGDDVRASEIFEERFYEENAGSFKATASIYARLISLFAQKQQHRKVLALFRQMLANGYKPQRDISFLALHSSERQGAWKDAVDIHRTLAQKPYGNDEGEGGEAAAATNSTTSLQIADTLLLSALRRGGSFG